MLAVGNKQEPQREGVTVLKGWRRREDAPKSSPLGSRELARFLVQAWGRGPSKRNPVAPVLPLRGLRARALGRPLSLGKEVKGFIRNEAFGLGAHSYL